MSAYKQFLTSDVIVAPFEVHKEFAFSGSQLTGSDISISRFLGRNINFFDFSPIIDPVTGNYTIVTPGVKAYYIYDVFPIHNIVASIGSGSIAVNSTLIVITGSNPPSNGPSTIYVPSGSVYTDTIVNIINSINQSSSFYPGITNISASGFNFGTFLFLEDKIAGYLGNFNALVASTGSNAGFNTTFTPNVPNYFVGGVNDIITGSYEYQRLIYHSIQELYYSNYTTCQYGDPDTQPILIPGANLAGDVYIGSTSSQAHYFNYLQTTLSYPRFYPTASEARIGVLSIPNYLFGDFIQPNSFYMSFPFNSQTFEFYDDGEGNLRMLNNFYGTSSAIVGNVIYPHGIITLTGNSTIYDYINDFSSQVMSALYATAIYNNASPPYVYGEFLNWLGLISEFVTSSNVTCSFSSSYTIYETQYKCTIRENEFNYTLNPSSFTSVNSSLVNTNINALSPCVTVTSSNVITNITLGIPYDYVNQDYFSPYITTVGLYDEQQNLLAIGKLSQPLPSSPTTDTTILINIDR